MAANLLETEPFSEREDDDDEETQLEAWDDWQSDEDESPSDYLCLFCNSKFDSTETLFDHCTTQHSFDFHGIVKDLGLDLYGSMKLINYVRSQVSSKHFLLFFEFIFFERL